MIRVIIAALFLLFQVLSAQATRFVYEMTMKPDSTDLNYVLKEDVFLDTDGLHSIFFSENKLKRDSVFAMMRQTKNFDRSATESYSTKVDYQIKKDYTDQAITFVDRIARDTYEYTETQPMVWEILPDTQTIGSYAVQKAKANYGCRVWYAWFTMDIPFPDGLYKFFGLPGLIVKVEDDKGHYSFDLRENKSIEALAKFNSRKPPLKVKKEDYLKVKRQYEEDPIGFINRNTNIKIEIKGVDTKKKYQEENKNNNNPIEL